MPRRDAICSNCSGPCVARDEYPSCNNCLPIVKLKRLRRKNGGWAQCLVTIAKIERWFAHDRLTA